ncbi:Phospholipase A(1) [Psychromonas ingrahamii 37]|uniref:Phospholipase A1 n=1 Tax=Psychromonas ingrahamii (strain DSM 17664 / CCUG 51855 / 37) TaxID=357804 RepID=A1T0B1_PSYIN|nr:phospholipase A [Psychromonas ingrahamii]ABM05176.1 Phospholipase A(1) [Psychromonas ingrahamii 37]
MYLLFLVFVLLFSAATRAEESAVDQRIEQENKLQKDRFSIIPYKPNYLLPFTFNNNIQSYDADKGVAASDRLQPVEIKFQLSFKTPVLVDIADLPLTLYFGYTQVSFWQAYNSGNSSPFRETNYEPEMFLRWVHDTKLGGDWHFKLATLNLAHQSNGKTEPGSRSWNRIESNIVLENGNITLAFNPWFRLPEDAKNDNNPDLLDYYGHGKIYALYQINKHNFSITSRNNIESGFSKGSLELNWSVPLHGSIRGYFQVFSGYGNSLIEYNQYTNTVGLGISLTDWL